MPFRLLFFYVLSLYVRPIKWDQIDACPADNKSCQHFSDYKASSSQMPLMCHSFPPSFLTNCRLRLSIKATSKRPWMTVRLASFPRHHHSRDAPAAFLPLTFVVKTKAASRHRVTDRCHSFVTHVMLSYANTCLVDIKGFFLAIQDCFSRLQYFEEPCFSSETQCYKCTLKSLISVYNFASEVNLEP